MDGQIAGYSGGVSQVLASVFNRNQENIAPDQGDVKPPTGVSIRQSLENLRQSQIALTLQVKDQELRLTKGLEDSVNCIRKETIDDLAFVRTELNVLLVEITKKQEKLASSQSNQAELANQLTSANTHSINKLQLKMGSLESKLAGLKAEIRARRKRNRGAIPPASVAAGQKVNRGIPANPVREQPPRSEGSPRAAKLPKRADRMDCRHCGKNLSRGYVNTHIRAFCKKAPKRKL